MRIVIISSCSFLYRRLIARLDECFSLAAVIRPVFSTESYPARDVTRRFELYMERLFFTARMHPSMKRRLWPLISDDRGFPHEKIIELPRDEICGIFWHDTLSNIRPDLVITAGAPVLPPQLLGIASAAAINVHHGIAPRYRGNHTLFWALYHRDYGAVGVTVHHLGAAVDGGAVIARGYPEIVRRDNEASLLLKCTEIAGDLCETIIERCRQGLPVDGRVQDAAGSFYPSRERTVLKSVRHFIQELDPRKNSPHMAERREYFFEE